MPYAPPDISTFRWVFPAFADVAPEQYDFWAAEAARVVNPVQACLGPRADMAAMLATAHFLTQHGLGSDPEAGMGGFRRIKSGQLELDRGPAATGGGGQWAGTSYGERLWPLLRHCLAGPRVTPTGNLSCFHGGYR